MSELYLMQNLFQSYLLGKDDEMRKRIQGNPEVYYEGYFLRLRDVLKADFPTLYKILGEKEFSSLARHYLSVHPSQFFSVGEVGKYMSEFLSTEAPFLEKPYLAELAQFEFALSSAMILGDAPVFSMEAVARIPQEAWPTVRFGFHPSFQQLIFKWNVPDVWKAFQGEQNGASFAPFPEASLWSVWRKERQPYYRQHLNEEVIVVKAIEETCEFAEICQRLAELMPEEKVAPYIVGLLSQWIRDDMLTLISNNH